MAQERTPTPESETLLALIKQRYSERLTPAELEEVRKGVDGIAQAASALRSVALENGDEPFSIFMPYRQESSD
jgi:hypothetical protein